MQFSLFALLSLALLQDILAAPAPTPSAEMSQQGEPSGSLERRFLGGYGGPGGYAGVGLGAGSPYGGGLYGGGLGYPYGGGLGYPYGGGYMSGGSSGQSSSFNSNSMSSVGPFGYATSNNQAAATNNYSNSYGTLFQKDAEANKKPTDTA